MLNRRAFLCGAISTALTAPGLGEAQQVGKVYRVGLLTPNSPALARQHFGPFIEALRGLGYEEGRNVWIERRHASGRLEEFPALVADLLRQSIDVIVAAGPHAIRASQAATTRIPIVMAISHEPVAMGFIKSFARPGGNTTGLAFQDSELSTKRLELLREGVPGIREVVALWDRAGSGMGGLRAAQEAAATLGLQLDVVETSSASDLTQAFDGIKAGQGPRMPANNSRTSP